MRQAMTLDRIAISRFDIPADSIRANSPNGIGHDKMTPMSHKGNCLVQGKSSPCQPSRVILRSGLAPHRRRKNAYLQGCISKDTGGTATKYCISYLYLWAISLGCISDRR